MMYCSSGVRTHICWGVSFGLTNQPMTNRVGKQGSAGRNAPNEPPVCPLVFRGPAPGDGAHLLTSVGQVRPRPLSEMPRTGSCRALPPCPSLFCPPPSVVALYYPSRPTPRTVIYRLEIIEIEPTTLFRPHRSHTKHYGPWRRRPQVADL